MDALEPEVPTPQMSANVQRGKFFNEVLTLSMETLHWTPMFDTRPRGNLF